MDEDAQKRNTDCVYFLASPLTCKKGNNCEFRHSEAARMNPRDCWYWVHSTCRNPNCSFRHPPLEGKSAPSVPPQSAATDPLASTTAIPAAALASKSKTACYFFSQGNCTKGDKCPFLHGPALPTSGDTVPQQKPPKAPQVEATQTVNKPVVVLKSVASNVTKPTPPENVEKHSLGQNYSQPVNFNATPVSAQEKPQTAKDGKRAKVLGSSVTANSYRMEKMPTGRKSRVTLFSDAPDEFLNSTERSHDVHDPFENRPGRPGSRQQQLSPYEHEHSNCYQGAEHRYQNGSKAETWWKNESSSLDGDGSDQSIQREDGEYSPHFGSRGRPKVCDDTTSRVFKGSQGHGREGFDSVPAQYRPLRYPQDREHQMLHESADQNGTSDHIRQHGFSSGTRVSVRDGQRMVSEGHTSSVDLRNHLLKRRKDDRGHRPRNESLSRRGHSEMVDASHPDQRRDDGFNQKDQHGRLPSRGVDHRGSKRLRHDGGGSPDGRPSRTSPSRRLGPGRSPDRALSAVSPKRHPGLDYPRSEARERSRDRYASKIASVTDIRSISTSKSMKSEYAKEDAGFTGPKSLAQIKAEKQAELSAREAQGRGRRGKHMEESARSADTGAPMSTNYQDSIASTSRLKRLHADSSLTGKQQRKLVSSEKFEGPKPLSLLLKEKQKAVSGNNGEMGMTGFKDDSNREVEDGEVQDEEEEWKDDHSRYADSPNAILQEELAPRSESDPNLEEDLEADHSQGMADADDDMGSPDDEMRLEIGQTLSGDEDYELDDDDDDDFAKKLGGIFS